MHTLLRKREGGEVRFHEKMYTKANLAALRVKKDIAEVRRETRFTGTTTRPVLGCFGTGVIFGASIPLPSRRSSLDKLTETVGCFLRGGWW